MVYPEYTSKNTYNTKYTNNFIAFKMGQNLMGIDGMESNKINCENIQEQSIIPFEHDKIDQSDDLSLIMNNKSFDKILIGGLKGIVYEYSFNVDIINASLSNKYELGIGSLLSGIVFNNMIFIGGQNVISYMESGKNRNIGKIEVAKGGIESLEFCILRNKLQSEDKLIVQINTQNTNNHSKKSFLDFTKYLIDNEIKQPSLTPNDMKTNNRTKKYILNKHKSNKVFKRMPHITF